MGDGQAKWPADRPRWGTYSVKGHTELARLIPDLLMYDVIVFPSPDTDEQFTRWDNKGWAPDLLASRVTQLGDHAVVCPWNETLRRLWESRMTSPSAQPEDAFTTTGAMIAEQSLRTLMGEEDDRYQQALLDSPKVRSTFGMCQATPRARTEPLELVAASTVRPTSRR